MWARFITVSELAATSGITLSCMLICSLFMLAIDDRLERPHIVNSFTPLEGTSLGYMALLVVSEFAQDALLHVFLVHERFHPRAMKLLSDDGRKLLDAKLFPPIFTSRTALADFTLPLLASTSFTTGFMFAAPRLS